MGVGLCILLLMAYACKKDNNTVKIVVAQEVKLSKTSIKLIEGETAELTASILPIEVTDKVLLWKSKDEAIATVVDGVVTAIKAGETEILASTNNGIKALCKISIEKKIYSVESVSLNKVTLAIDVEDAEDLVASIFPENADNKNVKWTSSDINVAYVIKGYVRGVSEGKATITVTTEDGSKTAKCEVTVTQPIIDVVSISLNASEATVLEENKIMFTAEILPKDATNKNITWTSSDEAIASIDSEGMLTGLKAGETTVTATTEDGNKTASCMVTVHKKQDADACVDLDGREYKTMIVGDKVWMAENYAYLPEVVDNNAASRVKPMCYVYEYMGADITEAKELAHYKKYGASYNWQAAMKYAPKGWHLPSDEEWKDFEKSLGMSEKEANGIYRHGTFGKKFKSTTDWNENGNGTDEFGFNVLPAGAVSNDLLYVAPTEVAYFWTSTDSEGSYHSEAFSRRCYYSQDSFLRYKHDLNSGMSVRYVKDKE